MIEELEGSVRELAELMSELSEEAYTAGWMDGLEYALWYAVENGPKKYGRITINEQHIIKLRNLSVSIGGWVYFDEEAEEKFINSESWAIKYSQNIPNYEHKIS